MQRILQGKFSRLQPLAGLLLLLFVARIAGGEPQKQTAVGENSTPEHAYSSAIDAGDYVYISGQGPRRADHSLPGDFAGQAQQALENLKAVVEAAGLTMEHVVYTQVYLEDVKKYRN